MNVELNEATQFRARSPGRFRLPPARDTCRAWRACAGRTAHLERHLRDLEADFATESLFEGLPLTFLAFIHMFVRTDPCELATCDAATIAATFPPYVQSALPPSGRPLTPAEAAALQGARCTALPLTADGWFTMRKGIYDRARAALDRSSGFFERPIEFPLYGAAPRSYLAPAIPLYIQTAKGHPLLFRLLQGAQST